MIEQLKASDPNDGHFYDVYQTEPPAQRKTIYFIGPYTGRLLYFKILISRLVLRGYRILYLQPHTEVLNTQRPKNLEQSITEAYGIISRDLAQLTNKEQSYLLGISLGSYLGLNVLADLPIRKFIVVAGGVPLGNVFRTSSLFLLQRRKLKKQNHSYETVEREWLRFDKAFKSQDLKEKDVLALNSKTDGLIKAKHLTIFMNELSKAGAKVQSIRSGRLPHFVQALSANFRIRQIDKFFKS